MEFTSTPIPDLYVAKLMPITDSRGFFMRSYCEDELKKIGVNKKIRQINHSCTANVGAVRGMHYQKPDRAEIKMVRCIFGSVFDVAIDLREGSETFLHWYGQYLTRENQKMMIIPEGFAHGFQVIEPDSELLYFHTDIYTPELERGILFDEKRVGVKWPMEVCDLSDRDLAHKKLSDSFTGIKI